MKKILYSLLCCSLFLIGCGSSQSAAQPTPEATVEATPEPTAEVAVSESNKTFADLKVLSPTGAPGLTILPFIENGATVEYVSGPDMIQASLVSPSSEYDMIVAPINLGVKLNKAGQSDYALKGVVTWGNLYLVGNPSKELNAPDTSIVAFGEQAVTGLVFKKIYPELADKASWVSSVSDAQAELLAQKVDFALLAEPAATATIAKAKENNLELAIIDNLQEKWSEEGTGYPQAGLFVKQSFLEEQPELVNEAVVMIQAHLDEVNANPEAVIPLIEEIGNEKLGVPNAQIISKTWPRLNLRYEEGEAVQDQIDAFLAIFQ